MSIEYDEFGFIIEGPETSISVGPELEPEPLVPIRSEVPAAGVEYLGGKSDGWEYRTVFAGGKILFHTDSRMRNALVLCLYNEQVEDHLLRFHGVLKPTKKPS